MKTCRKWVAALFAIILTVSSCVVVAEEALPTQWDLTEIYENVDAWQADYDRAMEILPQYESYQGTLNIWDIRSILPTRLSARCWRR